MLWDLLIGVHKFSVYISCQRSWQDCIVTCILSIFRHAENYENVAFSKNVGGNKERDNFFDFLIGVSSIFFFCLFEYLCLFLFLSGGSRVVWSSIFLA